MQINTNISLSTDEQEIFSIIKEVIKKYTPTTKAYAVGGWSRDKLLQIRSEDIDIMLSNISGEDFAKLVTRHLNIKDPHIIRENPSKSKHITTSKAYIPLSSGKIQEIDFAQARKEIYNDNSRIPEIKPATPQEDAYRRDFTINSLFYDILENKLIDYTGKGIKDLISNTIRTPLEPLKTFQEDPLRIIRAIRFSAKYNAKIDPETYKAMTDPSLRNEIKNKISKERIGAEFIKMLKNPNSQYAIQLLKDTGLLEDIITESIKGTPYEGKLAKLDMNQENPNHQLTLWEHTMEVVKGVIEQYKEAEPEKRIIVTLAALMHDIGKLYQDIWAQSKSHPGHRSYHGHEDESAKLINIIFRYLKIEPYIQEVSLLAQSHMHPHSLLRDEGGIRALRKFIRKMGEQSLDWLDVFNIALSDAYAKDAIKDPSIGQEYGELRKRLQEALNTMSVTTNQAFKPVLDGNEIINILNIKPGPHMKELTNFIKELMDENPNISKEEASQQLITKYKNKLPPKTSQNKNNKQSFKTCPKHLLISKIEEIRNLMDSKKYYEVFTILSQLHEEFNRDEQINRLLAIYTFRLLLVSEKYRSVEILQHIFDRAEEDFFDSVLCSYVFGMLVLLETNTKTNVIRKIGKRVSKMSPKLLKTIVDSLNNTKVFHPEILKEIKEKL